MKHSAIFPLLAFASFGCDGPDFYIPIPDAPDFEPPNASESVSSQPIVDPAEGGLVFVDRDGDGEYSPGDGPVGGAYVFWETTQVSRTDSKGRFRLVAPEDGFVWVRTPAGFSPQLAWAKVEAGPIRTALALTPALGSGESVTFVHATDTHLGTVARDLVRDALFQSVDRTPAPDFVAITGDLSSWSNAEEYSMLHEDLSALGTAWVPVRGNHDSVDGGEAFAAQFGPSIYSFDAGGVHFVVINNERARVIDFLYLDLSLVDDEIPVVVLGHFPPGFIGHPQYDDTILLETFATNGVDYMFSGHWHENRVMDHSTFLEYTTQPLARAGLDITPGGFRVARWDPDTVSLGVEHHTVVKQPVLELVAPRPGSCVPPGTHQLLVASEVGAATPIVTISADGWTEEMEHMGGWGFAALAVLTDSTSSVTVAAQLGDGSILERQFDVCIGQAPAVSLTLDDWPQFQGDAQHNGVQAAGVTPPLSTAWSTNVGGHVHGGSPILYQNHLYVPVLDLGDGSRGGMVVLDARTGEDLWEVREGLSTRNAPAAADGVVVFLGSDAYLRAYSTDDGAFLWSHNLGQGISFAATSSLTAPAIQDGLVYAGVVRRFAAVDLHTGATEWETVPYDGEAWTGGTYASATVLPDTVVAAFGRKAQLVAWNRTDYLEEWSVASSLTIALNTTPIVYGNRLYAAIGDSTAFALNPDSGAAIWQRKLDPKGTSWNYSIVGTPVASSGIVVYATTGVGVVGLDSDTGAPLWTVESGTAPIHTAGHPSTEKVHVATPVITGEIVWVGGADGVLRAIDLHSGTLQWSIDLGSPILSAAVPADGVLFVATWDGTVRALVSASTPESP